MNEQVKLVERLYRYRSLNGDYGRSSVERMIDKNEMWFASPDSFNDPFDCVTPTVLGNSQRDFETWLREVVRRNFPTLPRRERKAKLNELRRMSRERHLEAIQQFLKEGISGSAVCCFSADNANQLMWSHYADHHRGICWVFDQLQRPEQAFCLGSETSIAIKVDYDEDRPVADITTMSEVATFKAIAMTKSTLWAYEQEHRCFDWRMKEGFRQFSPELLRGVILGARISEDDEAFIIDAVSRRDGLELYRARLDDRRFHIHIDKL